MLIEQPNATTRLCLLLSCCSGFVAVQGGCSSPRQAMVLPVALSVYDVVKPSKSKSSSMAALVKLNTMTAGMRFGGCFHGGMVVDGIEWSFGYSVRSSGVYCVEPGKVQMLSLRVAHRTNSSGA